MIRLVLGSLLLVGAVVRSSPVLTPREGNKQSFSFSLPDSNSNIADRAAGIKVKREGWLYGPSIAGDNAPYPIGPLAEEAIAEQTKAWFSVLDVLGARTDEDTRIVLEAMDSWGDFTSLDDYQKIYDNHWKLSLYPGPFPGMLSNYTDDRLFSMERLSTSPYSLKLMRPGDALLFAVENAVSIAGMSLEDLQAQERLFVVDYSSLKDLSTEGKAEQERYVAACQAYFYTHPESNDFLPLAIKTSDLVYTPEDGDADWLLAKMIFNANDIFHITWFHFTASHSASEHVYLPAIRTLSEDHPLMGILHRMMKQAWPVRALLHATIFNDTSPLGQGFPFVPTSAAEYADALYRSGDSSNFQGNYLLTNLERRGLLGKFKSFPFLEDATAVLDIIRAFLDTTVKSYYRSDAAVAEDPELQAWIREAVVAGVHDFPTTVDTRDVVVDMLTHVAYLVSVVHNTMSGNTGSGSTAALPFHPEAFRVPLPTQKGVKDVMTYMPGKLNAILQVSGFDAAQRLAWRNTDETILHMFDEPTVLAKMNEETRRAEADYRATMNAFSDVVKARTFDKDGLNKGMPFLWQVLDPNLAAFWSTV